MEAGSLLAVALLLGQGRCGAVRKCCPRGEAIVDSRCAASSEPPAPPFESDSELLAGFPCLEEGFFLEPDEAEVAPNGSLYLKDSGEYTESYCLEEWLPRAPTRPPRLDAFVCFGDDPREEPLETDDRLYSLSKAALLFVSCFFLCVTFSVYAFLPSFRNMHGKTLMCHTASLFVAYALLGTAQCLPEFLRYKSDMGTACHVLGYGTLFAFLAAFSWLNVLCFDIWWTFGVIRAPAKAKSGRMKTFLMYSAYAWGLPSFLVSTAVVFQVTQIVPEHWRFAVGDDACWFSGSGAGKWLLFNGPVLILLLSNFTYFGLTVKVYFKVKDDLNHFRNNSITKRKFRSDSNKMVISGKLFLVMGISWMGEILPVLTPLHYNYWAPFDLINALQGLIIFLVFICKKKVVKALKVRLACGNGGGGRDRRQTTLSTLVTSSVYPQPKLLYPLIKSKSDSKLSGIAVNPKGGLSCSDLRVGDPYKRHYRVESLN